MIIGSLQLECFIYESHSLKDKRSVLQKVMMRLKNRLNVAVSETDFQNLWQRAELSIVTVSSSKTHAEKELNQAVAVIDSFPEIERTITTIEWL